ncbi:hypothetical protein ACVWWO_003160 [Bradyrhizobium sp. F1.13.1]
MISASQAMIGIGRILRFVQQAVVFRGILRFILVEFQPSRLDIPGETVMGIFAMAGIPGFSSHDRIATGFPLRLIVASLPGRGRSGRRPVVDIVVERLQTQAAEIEAFVAALEEPRRRGLLTPVQLREVHNNIVQLKSMLCEAERQAKALKARKATTRLNCMKAYAFASQTYLEHLRAAHELVHIHTKRPVYGGHLATLDDGFAACHVKSTKQRGYNRHWRNARAATGHEDVVIHRGMLTPAFSKSLLNAIFSGQLRDPLAEAGHGPTQIIRHGT